MECYNSVPVLGGILLNSNVNWSDPNSTLAPLDEKPWTVPALDVEANLLCISSITSLQFMDFMILHELAHYNGVTDPDAPSFEKRLWTDCIL